MHTSLRPQTNMKLLVFWIGGVLAVASVVSPTPWLFFCLGAVLGVCAGTIQLRALRESAAGLLSARTTREVRCAVTSSRSGRVYLYVFWASMVVLFVLASFLLRGRAVIGLIAGYSAFAFMRELLTLRGTIELQRPSKERTA